MESPHARLVPARVPSVHRQGVSVTHGGKWAQFKIRHGSRRVRHTSVRKRSGNCPDMGLDIGSLEVLVGSPGVLPSCILHAERSPGLIPASLPTRWQAENIIG